MLLAVGVPVLLLAGIAGWLTLRAADARAHLVAARAELGRLEAGVRGGGVDPADRSVGGRVAKVAAEARAARDITSDGLWRLASGVPGVGCPLRSAAALAETSERLVDEVVEPLLAAAPAATPTRGRDGIRVNVGRIRKVTPMVATVASSLASAWQSVAKVPTCGAFGAKLGLKAARSELSGRVRQLSNTVEDLRLATELLPPMLGDSGPRRYLLVVQNDAESRATGGVVGGTGLLTAVRGRLSLDTHPAGNLPYLGTKPVVRLPPDLEARHGAAGITTEWANANFTPHYPVAGRIYEAMWARGTGERLDGVITIDPTLLGYLLTAVGTARMPDGRRVTGAELPALLQSRIYALLPTNAERDAYFTAAGAAIYQTLLTSTTSPVRLLPALGRAAGEGRLLVWSRHPAEQRLIERTPLGGALPTTKGPFLAVVTQNGTGSKLEYWLRRSTDYRLRRLPDGTGEAVVTARLTNTAPPRGLPAYVRLRIEDGAPRRPVEGQNRLYVSVYGGRQASFSTATLDGRPVDMESQTEVGLSVFSTYVTLNPGQTATLRLVLSEPDWRPYVVVRPQPLIHPEPLTVTGAEVRAIHADI